MKKLSIAMKVADCIPTVCRRRIVVVPGSARPVSDDGNEEAKLCGHPAFDKNCCRTHMVVLPGYGSQQYQFPPVDVVVAKACARLAVMAGAGPKQKGQSDRPETGALEVSGRKIAIPGLDRDSKKGLLAQLPGTAGGGPTLFAAAEGLRVIFHNGRFEAIIAEKFDRLTGAVNWARNNMPAKYQEAIASLDAHLTKLTEIYREALPKIMDFLAAQSPQASKGELLAAAVQVVDEQLAEILFVLRIWTDAFGQLRDGMYKELQSVVFTVEQAYHLFRTGDINGVCDEECEKRLKSRVFGVKDVFVARFSGFGPATIPGTRGPVGAHAIEVPHDERDIISLMLVLYLHEFRHDIFHDVEGLADAVTKAVVDAIDKAYKAGVFKLTTGSLVKVDGQEVRMVKLGSTKVPTIELLKKIYADTLGEVDADIAGGVLLSGPAFLYNMLATFSAFNAKENGVFNQDVLLRSGSHYEVDEKGHLTFESHMPDYMRVYVVAAALDLLGFNKEATECRQMADQAAGLPLPQEITWVDSEGKRKMVIKVSCEDLKALAPVVAEALIRSPLAPLGGVSMERIVNWTPKRQKKVDLLVANLMAGKADVPTDKGHYFATYVAAAATLAYWGLVKSGVHPVHAAHLVEDNALKMLDTVKQRLEAEAATKAQSGDASGGSPCPAQDKPDTGSAPQPDDGAAADKPNGNENKPQG